LGDLNVRETIECWSGVIARLFSSLSSNHQSYTEGIELYWQHC